MERHNPVSHPDDHSFLQNVRGKSGESKTIALSVQGLREDPWCILVPCCAFSSLQIAFYEAYKTGQDNRHSISNNMGE